MTKLVHTDIRFNFDQLNLQDIPNQSEVFCDLLSIRPKCYDSRLFLTFTKLSEINDRNDRVQLLTNLASL